MSATVTRRLLLTATFWLYRHDISVHLCIKPNNVTSVPGTSEATAWRIASTASRPQNSQLRQILFGGPNYILRFSSSSAPQVVGAQVCSLRGNLSRCKILILGRNYDPLVIVPYVFRALCGIKRLWQSSRFLSERCPRHGSVSV